MTDNRYFIKDGYVENEVLATMDHVSGQTYWHQARQSTADLFQKPVYDHAQSLAKAIDAATLVDVGCGVGNKLKTLHEALPDLSIVGIDQEGAIEVCKSVYDFGEWIVDDFENPFAGGIPENPDIVICADVIEHVLDPDLLLGYIKRLSGPGTHIILSTPERDVMRGEACMHSPHPQHIREWNSDELARYVTSRGFSIVDAELKPPYPFTLRPDFVSREIKRILLGRGRKNNQMLVMKISNTLP